MRRVDRCWPLLTVETVPTSYRVVKRLIDVVLGLVLLVAVAPILVGAALLVRLESPGAMFVGHHGIGLGGLHFTFYRLRTTRSASAAVSRDGDDAWCGACSHADMSDAHSSLVGRFLQRYGIDELPQLWNVVRGDMSLV
jgi:lipopolysaccharide/colanic/teichoic acid biosynthesis glycosyltransferase